MGRFNFDLFENTDPQTLHNYDLLLVCIHINLFKAKSFAKTEQDTKNVFICEFLHLIYVKMLNYRIQMNSFSFQHEFACTFLILTALKMLNCTLLINIYKYICSCDYWNEISAKNAESSLTWIWFLTSVCLHVIF